MKKDSVLNLGQLQANLEQRSKDLKAANTKLKQASDAQARAEEEYHIAHKSLQAGMTQVMQTTKVV